MPEDQLQLAMSLPSWAGRVAAAHTVVRELRAHDAYRLDLARFAALRVPTLLLAGSEASPSCAGHERLRRRTAAPEDI
ncbi:MAG TPA: hypothetical protein VM367_05705 [Pseudonocardia sp.]|jgi:hypothetical protein|nr:hypothetical protein [Pseudonocardia sp.]